MTVTLTPGPAPACNSPATLSSSSCHFWRTVLVRRLVVMPAFQESRVAATCCCCCPVLLLLLLVRGPYTSTSTLRVSQPGRPTEANERAPVVSDVWPAGCYRWW